MKSLFFPAMIVAACASPPPTAPPPAAPPPVAPSAPAAPASVAAPPPPAAPADSAPDRQPIPEVDLGTFDHTLAEPVTSLALGEPRVAALGKQPWLYEDGKWKAIAIPERLALHDGDTARIFFGRDDRPRMMGTRANDGKPEQLYLRYRLAGWQRERAEIARLGGDPPAGLFGVLGHADPEVVCKVGDTCIVKRRTGWKTMPAGPGSPRVELVGATPWALYADAVARLEDDTRWTTVGAPAPFKDPGGIWASGDDVWVSEPGADKLHHFHAGAWQGMASPVAHPRGLFATSPSDLWLAGKDGLAHFDGSAWARVKGPTGPIAVVRGRGQEIWAAGQSGVWVRR